MLHASWRERWLPTPSRHDKFELQNYVGMIVTHPAMTREIISGCYRRGYSPENVGASLLHHTHRWGGNRLQTRKCKAYSVATGDNRTIRSVTGKLCGAYQQLRPAGTNHTIRYDSGHLKVSCREMLSSDGSTLLHDSHSARVGMLSPSLHP